MCFVGCLRLPFGLLLSIAVLGDFCPLVVECRRLIVPQNVVEARNSAFVRALPPSSAVRLDVLLALPLVCTSASGERSYSAGFWGRVLSVVRCWT